MSTKGTHIPDWLAVPFAGITPAPTQQKGQDLFPTGNWRAIRPVYRDKMPPCNNACGTNEKIQGYLDLVKRGKYLDAYALIKEDMPFPSVTGRVCYHPCEQACNRGKYDEAISIRAVERFLGDLGQALPRDVVKAGPPNGKKVAVVGSGPAGHSAAYQLARLGYQVTILEKSPRAGGLNRGGIPDWVLPQDVLDREVERLVELGITIKTNTEVGKDVSWEDLKKNYDACVLAVGLTEANSARAEGEDKQGVLFGLPFLRDIGMGTSKVKLGARVAVIGGGNTAIDCAREALRQGAEEVTMITVEGNTSEMPAVPEDLHDSAAVMTYFPKFARVQQAMLNPVSRKKTQEEVIQAFSEEQAVEEAGRCFSCGTCNACDNCYLVCPEPCIVRSVRSNGLYKILVDYCKGCRVCIEECPTGCLEGVPELDFDTGVVRM